MAWFRQSSRPARLKAFALALLAIPVGFLCLFAVGEIAAGDWSGLSHLVQALPLVLVGLAAYRWPAPAGWLLVAVGAAFVVLYAVLASSRFGIGTVAIVEAVLAVPVVAGVLLVLAGRSPGRSAGGR
jgi:hypothetical protein